MIEDLGYKVERAEFSGSDENEQLPSERKLYSQL